MGKREIHICDVCKTDLLFDGMFPKFQAAELRIQLYKDKWGDSDYIASFKGELCAECVAIINRTAEFFHREVNQRFVAVKPGESTSSPEADRPHGRIVMGRAKGETEAQMKKKKRQPSWRGKTLLERVKLLEAENNALNKAVLGLQTIVSEIVRSAEALTLRVERLEHLFCRTSNTGP